MSATVVGHPPNSEQAPERDSGSPRRPWEFWRSPADQPGWARPALLLTAAVAAVLYAWNITSSGYAFFYSDSVKSMSVSWKALFFGALDPGSTVTPDKIAGSFVPQALSARLFGFHAWSVTLPQCIEGVICVLVMYRVVRRWTGPRAGLAAAAAFTFTPVVASMFGHSMEDGGLTFCLVMAADCYQRAVLDARLRSLLFAGAWVGLGFQAKMLQAWMILPALAVGYLFAAPAVLRRRVVHLALAGAVCLAVSLSWVLMMTVVPAKDRPYADGSTNNSAIAAVFGYNGLERFGIHLPGSLPNMGSGGGFQAPGGSAPGAGPSSPAGTASAGAPAAGAPAAGAPSTGAPSAGAASTGAPPTTGPAAGAPHGGFPTLDGGPSWLKLFEGRLSPQIGWLYPFAFLALAFGLWSRRGTERTDRLRGGYVMWGTWLVVVGLVFSKMSLIPHTAYMSTLAPALAALAGAGGVLMWDAYRKGERSAWVLPAAVATEAGWAWYLGHFTPDFLPWLKWLVVAAAALGVIAMVWGQVSRRSGSRLLLIGLLAGLAGAVATPVVWSASVLDPKYAGSSFDAGAGPSSLGLIATLTKDMGGAHPPGQAGAPGSGASRRSAGAPAAGGFAAPGADVTASLSPDQRKLYDYVKARQDGAKYVLAVDGWIAASPYILATGDTVMPMGGFSSAVPQPSPSGFDALVHSGNVRFVLVQDATGVSGLFGRDGGTAVGQIDGWVKQHCTEVPATSYGVAQATGSDPLGPSLGMTEFFGDGRSVGGTLYSCPPSS
ncbi:ArnT family glycosyltransferase [Kitasatospora kifunensis]|uniref:4-amino-4-deoxy-L-arabinose transferase-like glycosyltransferase n=1 Tax=Kitasatospora kifunensis TaxID=58351 RepID=A0A7W7VY61_KITKI|nr:glycosyltransferase family 39 protein [Kitasatospora kifunensis]MBB4927372.1 4-amino-4-deoxy-L-arabinose transferase-like glycosyltransferase [Kitasatospora kifunensis]